MKIYKYLYNLKQTTRTIAALKFDAHFYDFQKGSFKVSKLTTVLTIGNLESSIFTTVP